MMGMVAALSDQDMKDLAAYFASKTTKAGSTPEVIDDAGDDDVGGEDASGVEKA